MKNRKLILILSLVLALTMSLGGTLAYLTDTDGDVNVMTVGKVTIEQNEHDREGNEYDSANPKQLLPIVNNAKDPTTNYNTGANYIDKIVTVKNTGNTKAWVRTLIAFPHVEYQPDYTGDADASKEVIHWNGGSIGDKDVSYTKIPHLDKVVGNNWYWGTEGTEAWPGNSTQWNWVKGVEINGKPYIVYIATHTAELGAGETTAPNLTGIYLDEGVDYDNDSGYYVWGENRTPITYVGSNLTLSENVEVYVLSQAVQAGGFDTAWKAFEAAFPMGNTDAEKQTKLESWFKQMQEPALPNLPADPENPTNPFEDYEKQNEFVIDSVEDMYYFAKTVNEKGKSFSGKTVKLDADIELKDYNWTPIGQTVGYSAKTYFQGIFDGQSHTISDFKVTHWEAGADEGKNYATGLFGFIDEGAASIKNLKVTNANVEGGHWTGVIAGYLTGTIEKCEVTDSTVLCVHKNNEACGDKAGTIVGYINSGAVRNCSATNCTVRAGRDAGQLVGCNTVSAHVTDCTATNVVVSATGDCTGANIKNEIVGRE